MGRNMNKRPKDMRNRILQVALELFTKQGYDKTSLREIAERPTLSELQQRMEGRTPVKLPVSAAVLVRAERDAR